MKKFFAGLGLAGLICAPMLQAATVTLYQGSGFSWSNGGEFRAVPVDVSWEPSQYSTPTKDVSGGGGFQTFCIEYNEHFNPGTSYYATISDQAMFNNGKGSDAISIGTAWLYSQFAAGVLGKSTPGTTDDYNYTLGNGRVTSAGQLQQAIWFLEDESGGQNNMYVALATAAVSALGYGDVYAAANGAFGVRVLNLWNHETLRGQANAIQDQLVIVPEPTTLIAGGLLLLPLGISAVRIMRKRQA